MTSEISRWNDSRPREAFRLALLGATDKQIAEFFECNVQTVDYWKRKKPAFAKALRAGKMEADAKVAESFYKRATGYDVTENKVVYKKGEPIVVEVTRHIPADPWSAHKWLSTRCRDSGWADVQKHEILNTNLNITKIDLSGMTWEQLKVIKELGLQSRNGELPLGDN